MVALVRLQVEGVKLWDGSAAELDPECSLTTEPGFHLVGDHGGAPGHLWLLPAERGPAGPDLFDHDVDHGASNAALIQLSLFSLRRLASQALAFIFPRHLPL